MRSIRLATAVLSTVAAVSAQTFSACNPMKETCHNNPSFPPTYSWDFTNGPSGEFTATGTPGNIAYDGTGAKLSIAKSGDAPTLTATDYFFFGKVTAVIEAAPGVGIVSSLVLLSDTLDEIDLEWLGSQPNQVQSNWYGKGHTGTYNRGGVHDVSNADTTTHTYVIDWKESGVNWYIDGTLVRFLSPNNATTGGSQFYPQTPMQLKIGPWAAGDPSNPPGTVQWAGGNIDYSQGPFVMTVKSIEVENYNVGSAYESTSQTGMADSIKVLAGSGSSGNSTSSSTSTSTSTSSSKTQSSSTMSSSSRHTSIATSVSVASVGSLTKSSSATPSSTTSYTSVSDWAWSSTTEKSSSSTGNLSAPTSATTMSTSAKSIVSAANPSTIGKSSSPRSATSMLTSAKSTVSAANQSVASATSTQSSGVTIAVTSQVAQNSSASTNGLSLVTSLIFITLIALI